MNLITLKQLQRLQWPLTTFLLIDFLTFTSWLASVFFILHYRIGLTIKSFKLTVLWHLVLGVYFIIHLSSLWFRCSKKCVVHLVQLNLIKFRIGNNLLIVSGKQLKGNLFFFCVLPTLSLLAFDKLNSYCVIMCSFLYHKIESHWNIN